MKDKSISDSRPSTIGPMEPYRYTVICWDDDCTEFLDTYGGPEILELARKHVEKHGHALDVQIKAKLRIEPS